MVSIDVFTMSAEVAEELATGEVMVLMFCIDVSADSEPGAAVWLSGRGWGIVRFYGQTAMYRRGVGARFLMAGLKKLNEGD